MFPAADRQDQAADAGAHGAFVPSPPAVTVTRRRATRGLRPFDLAHDLEGVANVIEIAFREESQRPWLRVPDEMRGLRRLGPFLWLLGHLSPDLQDVFGGFVWEEEGRIVGNVTVGRVGGDPRRWILGNVGVLPEYRRRGIARRLTEAAIAHARAHGAEWVVLDVRADNEPAYTLYRDMGFRFIEATVEMQLVRRQPLIQATPPGLRLRPVGPRDAARLLEIQGAVTPPAVRAVFPSRRGPLVVQSLANLLPARLAFLRAGLRFTLAVEAAGRLIGYGQLMPRPPARTLRLWVLPEHQGEVERPLATALLVIAHRAHPEAILADAAEAHPAAVEAFERLGFERERLMHRLALNVRT